jgi:hypothetical protein
MAKMVELKVFQLLESLFSNERFSGIDQAYRKRLGIQVIEGIRPVPEWLTGLVQQDNPAGKTSRV